MIISCDFANITPSLKDASSIWMTSFNLNGINAGGVRTALYLKSNVKITTGDGSKEKLYKLGI